MASLLRPDPARAVVLAAGAVALTLLVLLIGIRFDEEWGTGIHLVYSALAAALVLALAVGVDRRDDLMPIWHSVLFVTAFLLALQALSYLADVLGSEDRISSSGTVVWTGLIMLALATFFAVRFGSGIAALFAAVTAVVVVVAFVDWVFSPEEVGTFRVVLLVAGVALAARAWMVRAEQSHQANGLVVAAGVVLLTIAGTFAVEALQGALGGLFGGQSQPFDRPGEQWEIVMLLGGAALIAWTWSGGASGPAYLGATALSAFLILASISDEDGPSLIGWPIVLAIATVVLLVLALRPAGGTQARSL
jgi:hypothetical protein